MYVPSSFARRDDDALRALIRDRGFATVITAPGGVPFASHLPLLLDGDVLVGHMARANPQWRHFDGATEVLAVFHGPHAYDRLPARRGDLRRGRRLQAGPALPDGPLQGLSVRRR
jgi:predicted FMN-binding regulatory protein PaiB